MCKLSCKNTYQKATHTLINLQACNAYGMSNWAILGESPGRLVSALGSQPSLYPILADREVSLSLAGSAGRDTSPLAAGSNRAS
jgi:hypothetical protein